MSLQVVCVVTTPADSYDLVTLAQVKAQFNLPNGMPYATSEDTASGQILPFLATGGIQGTSPTDGSPMSVAGTNIAPGTVVSAVTSTTVTLSQPVQGDVPAGTVITFGNDSLLDAFLSGVISQVSAAIQNYCARKFAVETLTETIYPQLDAFPSQVPGGLQPLQLSRWPIVAVISVNVFDVLDTPRLLVSDTDFTVKTEPGQLLKLNPWNGYLSRWDPVPTEVVYQAGYSSLPDDLVDACMRLISKSYWNRNRDPSIMETSGSAAGSTRYWIDSGKDGNFTPDIREILDAYRVPVAR